MSYIYRKIIMKNILVIHERDLVDQEQTVIGVADSVENAEKLYREYYGFVKELKYTDIRDSSLEYTKLLEVSDHENKPYEVEICLEWFVINK